MHDDFDDTVMVPSRRVQRQHTDVDEDTIVPERSAAAEKPVVSVAAGEADAAKQRRPPALVEPTRTGRRRVPLTHKRVTESLRAPSAARESGVLPPRVPPTVLPQALVAPVVPPRLPRVVSVPEALPPADLSAAVAPAPPAVPAASTSHGFRIGDRAVVTLDVPALIGRRPTAPRVPGAVFPRLVRVASPLNEVSSTHVELRQEGNSVIVTDLRSTNGTVVRMPGSRPVKLRQGESLVVRAGTQVDIGDGNVLEIIPPPRLMAPADAADRGWS